MNKALSVNILYKYLPKIIEKYCVISQRICLKGWYMHAFVTYQNQAIVHILWRKICYHNKNQPNKHFDEYYLKNVDNVYGSLCFI